MTTEEIPESAARQLSRQGYKCYGCLRPLDLGNPFFADYDYITGALRGILCNSCLQALESTKRDPKTLRRLMAYLDYKHECVNVYLAGALKNPDIPRIGNRLREAGFDVMDEWWCPGRLADVNWQQYEKIRGRTYIEALQGRSATNIALFDTSYIDHSDIMVVVMPAGKSAFLELGYAKGRGKHTCLLLGGKEPKKYDVMPHIVDGVFFTEDEMIEHLVQQKEKYLPKKTTGPQD